MDTVPRDPVRVTRAVTTDRVTDKYAGDKAFESGETTPRHLPKKFFFRSKKNVFAYKVLNDFLGGMYSISQLRQ